MNKPLRRREVVWVAVVNVSLIALFLVTELWPFAVIWLAAAAVPQTVAQYRKWRRLGGFGIAGHTWRDTSIGGGRR